MGTYVGCNSDVRIGTSKNLSSEWVVLDIQTIQMGDWSIKPVPTLDNIEASKPWKG